MTDGGKPLNATLSVGTVSETITVSSTDLPAIACGRRIVDMAWEHLTPDRILTAIAMNSLRQTEISFSRKGRK